MKAVRQFGERCTSSTSLSMGDWNKAGEGGARAIGEDCTPVSSLAVVGRPGAGVAVDGLRER